MDLHLKELIPEGNVADLFLLINIGGCGENFLLRSFTIYIFSPVSFKIIKSVRM
jgi:hypothetical protein